MGYWNGTKSQWAELRATWMTIVLKATNVTLCTDSWVIFKSLTLLAPNLGYK